MKYFIFNTLSRPHCDSVVYHSYHTLEAVPEDLRTKVLLLDATSPNRVIHQTSAVYKTYLKGVGTKVNYEGDVLPFYYLFEHEDNLLPAFANATVL